MVLTADHFPFPVTYIFGDILTRSIWISAGSSHHMAGICRQSVHGRVFHDCGEVAGAGILGTGSSLPHRFGDLPPRLVLASLLAYFVGEFSNSVILSRMKVITGGTLAGPAPSAHSCWPGPRYPGFLWRWLFRFVFRPDIHGHGGGSIWMEGVI